mgnify:CR=1 FL=1
MIDFGIVAENTRKIFAERLRALREDAKLTQAQLGDELGVSRGSISYYENMDRVPDIEFLVKVTDFFDVATDYMLGKSDNKEPLYQDIGISLGLSDKAIYHILEFDRIGEGAFNFMLESNSFIELAAIINVYFRGGWGYSIPFDIMRKILPDKDYNYDEDMLKTYKAESQYTEFLMAKAIISVLRDMRIELFKKDVSWQNEVPVSEKSLFDSLLSEVKSLASEYNKLASNKSKICPDTLDEAYKKLSEKVQELENFKLQYAKVADIKRRLKKIERAIENQKQVKQFTDKQKEGETNG